MEDEDTNTNFSAPIIGSQMNSGLDLIVGKQREKGLGAESASKAARKKHQAQVCWWSGK